MTHLNCISFLMTVEKKISYSCWHFYDLFNITDQEFYWIAFWVWHTNWETRGEKVAWPSYRLQGGKNADVLQENCSRLHGLPWAFISVCLYNNCNFTAKAECWVKTSLEVIWFNKKALPGSVLQKTRGCFKSLPPISDSSYFPTGLFCWLLVR